jgi:hypothetical protein
LTNHQKNGHLNKLDLLMDNIKYESEINTIYNDRIKNQKKKHFKKQKGEALFFGQVLLNKR